MKTCISWTKVSTNVICHDHEAGEVLLFQIYDFQMTWCDLYWHKMYMYFEDEIYNYCHDKKRQAFSKIWLWRHQLLTWLNWKLTRTPSFCSDKNLSLIITWNYCFILCIYGTLPSLSGWHLSRPLALYATFPKNKNKIKESRDIKILKHFQNKNFRDTHCPQMWILA